MTEKDQRYSRRVKTSFYVRVKGTDASGQKFDEVVRTSDFSKVGTAFSLNRELAIGAKLEISIPLPSIIVRAEGFAGSSERKYGVVFAPYDPETSDS